MKRTISKTKVCFSCKKRKKTNSFREKNGDRCIKCIRIKDRERYNPLYPEKVEAYKKKNKESYYRNIDKRKKAAKIIRETIRNDKAKTTARRKYMREYMKNRRQSDPLFRIKGSLRCSLYGMIVRRHGGLKSNNTQKLLGCSYEDARKHIESKWLPNMSWENYGSYIFGEKMTWHIDHIIPCDAFDLTKEGQQKKCFHHTNLQPLWATDNISKGKNLNWAKKV